MPPAIVSPSRKAHGRDVDVSSRKFDRVFTLFLAILTFAIFLVLLSELCLSHPHEFLALLSIFNPRFRSMLNTSPSSELELLQGLESGLERMERHTRVQASALSFGALVFVWYRVFILVIEQLIRVWTCSFNERKSAGSAAASSGSDADEAVEGSNSDGRTSAPRTSRFFVGSLIIIMIVNDSIYNRDYDNDATLISFHPRLITSPAPGAVFAPAFTRLISMASRAFPVCAAEVSILFLVLFAASFWLVPRNATNDSMFGDVNSSGDLEGSNIPEPKIFVPESWWGMSWQEKKSGSGPAQLELKHGYEHADGHGRSTELSLSFRSFTSSSSQTSVSQSHSQSISSLSVAPPRYIRPNSGSSPMALEHEHGRGCAFLGAHSDTEISLPPLSLLVQPLPPLSSLSSSPLPLPLSRC